MSTAVRSRRKPAPPPEPIIEEHRHTIPDALIAWAQETDRQLQWPRPYGDEAAALLRAGAEDGLTPDAAERLMSRLDFIASAAVSAGRPDLLLGFDLLTAEWLDMHIKVETPRGLLHIGPDPKRRTFDGGREPGWTYREIRIVTDAAERAAVDLAWAAKEVMRGAFPSARIADVVLDRVPVPCAACGLPPGPVMLTTEAGNEYHYPCWSELTAPMPEHLRKILRKAPKAKAK